jgi:fumarate reductase flavoprotein subunit
MIMVGGSSMQKELGYDDTPDKFAETELRYCGDFADRDMVREMCEASPEHLKFMEDLGREFTMLTPMMPVWDYDNEEEWAPRTHWQDQSGRTGHFGALEEEAARMDNVTVHTNKEAVHLITNDAGEVIGVETADGAKYRANKGVLLATASFGRNMEMSKRYNPMNYWALCYEEYYDTPSPNGQAAKNTGDGIRIAQEIGADLALTASNCISDCCALSFDSLYGTLLVNPKGERFVQENAHWGYLNQMVFNEAVRINATNPENLFWIITDENAVQNNVYFNCVVNNVVLTANPSYVKLVQKADSLEEIAEKTGLPAETLLATVARWNGMVENGADTDYGRRDYEGRSDLVKLEGSTYYAFPYIPYSMGSFGGLRTDHETRVLNTSGDPIPRLYAAGAIMSGMYTAPFYNACGWSLLGTLHWGRKAGVNISELTPWTTEEIESAAEEDEATQIQNAINAANGSYNAGTYQATVAARNGDMTVEVEFSDKAILSVKVVDHVETEGIGTAAVDKMPARILIAQGTDVDVVSSATVSSEAILEAVRDCIKQASK